MLSQPIKKIVVHVVMIKCHPIGILKGDTFRCCEAVALGIQLRDFFLSKSMFCTLQKPGVESGEAVVMPGYLQPNKLDEFLVN